LQKIISFLQDRSVDGLLSYADQAEAAKCFDRSLSEIEELALTNKILPARYQRNQNSISTQQQLTLFSSTVAVIGCGGLGGYIIEELARLGIGRLIVVDPDIFEEHNLNRQILCTLDQLADKKVAGAVQRVTEINPAVQVHPVAKEFNSRNGMEILNGVTVAADALDTIPARMQLAETCEKLDIPLVHGAIAGWYGTVANQFPGDRTLQQMYGGEEAEKGIETRLGNPSFTPALIASIEVAEIVKILLGTGVPLRNSYLHIDLYHLEVNEIPMNKG